MSALLDFLRESAGAAPDGFGEVSIRLRVDMAMLLVSPVLVWAIAVLLGRFSSRWRRAVTLVAAAAFVVLGLVVPMGLSVWWRLACVAGVCLATYAGLGPIVWWAVRRSVRELGSLGPMVGRVLPLLVFTMLSLFFTTEVWQVVVNLSMARTWVLCGVIVSVGLVLAAVTTRDFVNDVIDDHRDNHPHFTPLRLGERVNIVLDLMLITLVQVALLAGVVFIFFLGFGALSITDATAKAWTGSDLEPLHGIWSLLRVNQNLLQVSLLMASVAALSFIASAASDPAYRRAFVDPAMNEMRDGLELRRRYLNVATDPLT